MFPMSLLLILFSTTAFSTDLIPLGSTGKSIFVYEKDGYIYLRNCPEYKILQSKNDCVAKEERRLLKASSLKEYLYKKAESLLETTNDPQFPPGSYKVYKKLLDPEKKVKIENEYNKIIKSKELWGDALLDKKRLENLKEELESHKKALLVQEALLKELDLVTESILDGKVVHLQTDPLRLYAELSQYIASSDYSNCSISPSKIGGVGVEVRYIDHGSERLNSVSKQEAELLCKKNMPLMPVEEINDASISSTQRSIMKDDPETPKLKHKNSTSKQQ